MHGVKIKICGIQDAQTARAAFDLGADYLGFIFAGGPRKVTPEQVCSILSSLPTGTAAVGVFMDQPPEDVLEIVRLSGITHLQLHGEENPSEYRSIGLPILKAVPVTPEGIVGPFPLQGSDFALLDTRIPSQRGGTGKPFNWNNAKSNTPNQPFFVAGGLTPLNVREAIEMLSPYGVDVSSGVEIDGVKNLELISRFIKEIRR